MDLSVIMMIFEYLNVCQPKLNVGKIPCGFQVLAKIELTLKVKYFEGLNKKH